MNIALIISFSLVAVLLLVALIYSRRELRLSRAETATEREVARREADEQAARAEELQRRIVELTAEKGEAQTEAERRAVRIEALETRLADQQRAFEQEREQEREQQRATAEQQRAEQEQLQKTMQEQFRNLANDILEEKSRVFRQTNSESIEQLLKPFRDNITDFRLRVESIHRDDLERHGALKNELKNLMDLNRRITDETNNLTEAIRGNSKVQGDMGEMILTTILDHSNLIKGEHYVVQANLKDEEGNNLRPDVILNLPEGKRVIIDSKVSLTAYLDYTRAETEAERASAMTRHIESIRQHIKELSRKEYHRLLDCTPDFVLMFIPIESAFLEAMRECRDDLWLEAYNRKVILSSPTNLFAMLKLVDDLWQRDNRNRSTERIAQLGTKLYDQFVRFVGALEGVGKGLGDAQRSYDEAYKRLTSGNDNLVRNSERLRQYGINPKKLLNSNLLDAAEDSSGEQVE
ncbi:MAG: DNA recombination protein RmuC [Rikenellaceae bacterium]|nr:DNA recombination protein RmuC [Rikenellaceae bacterium]